MRSLRAHLADRLPGVVYAAAVRRPFISLYYHLVSSRVPKHSAHLGPCKTPAMFESDLEWLVSQRRLLRFADITHSPVTAPTLTSPPFVVTFDDGYVECHSVVAPLLRRHGVPAIFFVTTSFLDNRRMFFRNKISLCVEAALRLGNDSAHAIHTIVPEAPGNETPDTLATRLLRMTSTDEARIDEACDALGVDIGMYLSKVRPYLTSRNVQELVADGFAIGAHSVTHRHLGSISADEIEEEVVASAEHVQKLTGQNRVPFAFPFSGNGVPRELLSRILKRHRFIWPIFDVGGLRKDVPYVFPRVWADPRAVSTQSNLPHLVMAAYRDELRTRFSHRNARAAMRPDVSTSV